MRRPDLTSALDRLAAAERDFLSQVFLAPVIAGGQVRVRVAGVVCQLQVEPRDFRGFGLFRPKSHTLAELVGPATLSQRRAYLALFPRVQLILCRRDGDVWRAVTAHRGDARFRIIGQVPLQLVEDAQAFDLIVARFDGVHFWYEGPERSRDPATAAWLRAQLRRGIEVGALDRPGLTPEERWAYAIELPPGVSDPSRSRRSDADLSQPRRSEDLVAERLRQALGHAGAELTEYSEHRDGYRVTYTIDGREHVSSLDKHDLTVQVAGICLSGQDQDFDLASLVGVLRESHGERG